MLPWLKYSQLHIMVQVHKRVCEVGVSGVNQYGIYLKKDAFMPIPMFR